MLSIIVATDFSEVSNHAAHYACKLASTINAKITVLHSFMIPVTFTDNPMPVMPMEEGRNIAEEQMKKLSEELLAAYPSVEIDTIVTYGDVTNSLKEYVSAHPTWMVVIGNSSEQGTSFLLGSNLLSEMKSLNCSVMAVPPGVEFKPVEKICLACDFREVEEHLPSSNILNIVQTANAALHVLNVDHDNRHFKVSMTLESSSLHDMLKPVSPTYHYTDNENVEDGINDFIGENNIDWLVVTPHKHGFFDSLFHKSHTKQIVKKVHVPIIALHEK